MQITDRSKDVIKSGGEWISSIDAGEPRHRPSQGGRGGGDRRAPSEMGRAAAAGRRAQARRRTPRARTLLGFLRDKIANWWMPDDVVFVEEIPHTATGKMQKIRAARDVPRLRAAERQDGGVTHRVAVSVIPGREQPDRALRVADVREPGILTRSSAPVVAIPGSGIGRCSAPPDAGPGMTEASLRPPA